jgi:signal transduction histidine kinase
LIASLPETDDLAPELSEGRIRLLDSAGQPLYQWGSFEEEEDSQPVATLALRSPLGAWNLEYHASQAFFGSAVAGGFLLNLAAALALVAAAVIGLAYYFYREQSREMREAAQRVSFVNQVSHELKTPLTNIRMYAELLERDADEQDEQLGRRLGVIVWESQRLSRLIGNVLTFSRKQRRTLELHRKPGVVDDVLRGVLHHFRPALEAKEIEVEFTPEAGAIVSFDADAVEQIVGNLVSNVDKYGADGKYMALASRQEGETTEITVSDHGSGLPSKERQRVFEPFYRVNSALTEGVGGTGIGLSIARELARLHGGDLKLMPSEKGACFRVTLQCPPAEVEG